MITEKTGIHKILKTKNCDFKKHRPNKFYNYIITIVYKKKTVSH